MPIKTKKASALELKSVSDKKEWIQKREFVMMLASAQNQQVFEIKGYQKAIKPIVNTENHKPTDHS